MRGEAIARKNSVRPASSPRTTNRSESSATASDRRRRRVGLGEQPHQQERTADAAGGDQGEVRPVGRGERPAQEAGERSRTSSSVPRRRSQACQDQRRHSSAGDRPGEGPEGAVRGARDPWSRRPPRWRSARPHDRVVTREGDHGAVHPPEPTAGDGVDHHRAPDGGEARSPETTAPRPWASPLRGSTSRAAAAATAAPAKRPKATISRLSHEWPIPMHGTPGLERAAEVADAGADRQQAGRRRDASADRKVWVGSEATRRARAATAAKVPTDSWVRTSITTSGRWACLRAPPTSRRWPSRSPAAHRSGGSGWSARSGTRRVRAGTSVEVSSVRGEQVGDVDRHRSRSPRSGRPARTPGPRPRPGGRCTCRTCARCRAAR